MNGCNHDACLIGRPPCVRCCYCGADLTTKVSMRRLASIALTWIMTASAATMMACILMLCLGLARWSDPIFHVAYPLGLSAFFLRVVFHLDKD